MARLEVAKLVASGFLDLTAPVPPTKVSEARSKIAKVLAEKKAAPKKKEESK